MRQTLDSTAAAIGRGVVAGLAGTAAMMTAVAMQRRPRGPEATDVPARAMARVLGVEEYRDRRSVRRTNQLVHWGYGTALGAVRGLLGRSQLGRNLADVAFHGIVWGSEQVLLPALDLAPPVPCWGRAALANDLAHHAVYSSIVNGVYRWLDPRPEHGRTTAHGDG